MILGAGGMLIYDAATLAEMRRICAAYGVLFIADEVMTGFGRTGTLFASEQAHISPDILCVAKGITGGSIPLAATLCSEAIYASASLRRSGTNFLSFELVHRQSHRLRGRGSQSRNLAHGAGHASGSRPSRPLRNNACRAYEGDPHFANGRQIGTITAVELTGRAGGYLDNVALSLRSKLLARGVLLRPLGNTVYVMPPYCATADELKSVYENLAEAVDEVSA